MPQRPDLRRRGRLFIAAAGLALIVAVTSVVITLAGSAQPEQRAADSAATIAAARAQPHLFFRHAGFGDRFGRVGVAASSRPDARAAALTGLSCARFHFAAGRGICLTAEPGLFAVYRALLLDEDLAVVASRQLSGIPSRARVSPDGRYAAMTVFVSGHSYAGGSFSTQTLIVDAVSGETVADLEQFAVSRAGQPMREIDFNFWGVTFTADSDVFYATLGSGGQTHLVRGSIAEQRFEVLAQNVECPSLSPDGTRIAFKRRVDSGSADAPLSWRLHVLELADMSITPLGREERSIDDQLEWLDDEHVLYALEDATTLVTDVWVTAVDDGSPRTLLAGAESPAVVRGD